MPIVIANADILEVTWHTYCQNQAGLFVCHFLVTQPPVAAVDETQVANHFSLAIRPQLQALLSAQAQYRGAAWRRIRPLPVSDTFYPSDLPVNGNVLGDNLPKQAAGLLSKRGSTGGRHGKGRLYVPFPGEADSGNGVPSSGAPGTYVDRLTTLGTYFPAINTAVLVGPPADQFIYRGVVFSRATGLAHNIVAMTPRIQWATQRRRGDFGRINPPPF